MVHLPSYERWSWPRLAWLLGGPAGIGLVLVALMPWAPSDAADTAQPLAPSGVGASGVGAAAINRPLADTLRADTLRLDVPRAIRMDTPPSDTLTLPRLRRSGFTVGLPGPAGTPLVAAIDTVAYRPLQTPPPPQVPITMAADGSVRPDTAAVGPDPRFAPYLRPLTRRRTDPAAPAFRPSPRGLRMPPPPVLRHQVVLRADGRYEARERVNEQDVRLARSFDRSTYRDLRERTERRATFAALAAERERLRAGEGASGVGLNIAVPGGQQSPFTTIFGRPEVDLRVTGQADIRAGFDYRQSDQQAARTGQPSQVDPDFRQELRLGVTGTIGDKMQVDVNWDTERDFDYQNQLRLRYTGYDDEILQSVEAGNVFLDTPSSLIRGGQSLFGIKSELQFGGLRLTTVASQQEGQSNSLSVSGGAELTTFELRPTDYDEGSHFFLSYYHRNRWEDAHSRPENGLILFDGFERITDIEVWKLETRRQNEDDPGRQVVAMADLGESAELLTLANAFTTPQLPEEARDQYTYGPGGDVATELRPGEASARTYLEDVLGLSASDYQTGQFQRLDRGRDYNLNDRLGYLSLNQRLQESEALAVAFRYTTQDGQRRQVGDFASESGGSDGGASSDRLVLKLLRPSNLRPPSDDLETNPAAWYYEMRNLYRIGRNIQQNDFELDLRFEPPGERSTDRIPAVTGQETLLQVLGLDRLTEQGAPQPDNTFDFTPLTIDQGRGLLLFPFLEPFGERLAAIIDANAPPAQQADLRDELVFRNLYVQRKDNARRDARRDLYRVDGSYRGSSEGFFDLRSFSGLVEGSVRVTSNGSQLEENVDYVVDYQGGTVTITNERFLAEGNDIEIDYEQNAATNIQQKTLLGARADYRFSDQLALGATVMRLSERSLTDKFRVGEEPISNMIWGVDGSLDLEPQWLTRAVNTLPLVQTRAPSSITLSGEVAQLRPGHSQTQAFRSAQRSLNDQGRSFAPDEQQGVSFIDDFESFENTFSLSQPEPWLISSAPDSIGAVGALPSAIGDSLRTNFRASLGWYQLNANVLRELGENPQDPTSSAIALVPTEDIFPGRETLRRDNVTQTLDLYINPQERGPYNYTTDLRGFLDRPQDTWAGISRSLPDRFTDFSLNNIEFVEFIVQVHSDDGDADPDAKLYVDLGLISEDILPNGRLNTEDGLSVSSSLSPASLDAWGRRPSTTPNRAVDFDRESRRSQDVGLDGLASYPDNDFPEAFTAPSVFRRVTDALDPSDPDPRYRAEAAKMRANPSGDSYYYFTDGFFANPAFFPPELYPNGVPLQQRFSRYNAGYELSTFEGQNILASDRTQRRGRTSRPVTEDLNNNGVLDTENSYFQYAVPLNEETLRAQSDPEATDNFVVERISESDDGKGWYLVRIPIRNPDRSVGGIQDFGRIETMRLWTTGHTSPTTLRFAKVELVGSQWRDSEEVALEENNVTPTDLETSRVFVESINTEENAAIYRRPVGSLVAQVRDPSGGQVDGREQAMVLRMENLEADRQRGVFRTYGQPFDLLKYSNLRMFTHFHGRLASGESLADLAERDLDEARSKARLFVRLGSNETDDFYEYEQPLTPSRPTSGNADELWQTFVSFDGEPGVDLGSMNIELAALNQLKFIRDQRAEPTDEIFYATDADLQPRPSSFAPPGTRLGIKGTPSLERVSSIVIGIRTPAADEGGDPIEEAVLWMNELRVTGYDERAGWAGLFDADVRLADLGRVRGNYQFQTDGFGSLASTLDDREQQDTENWSLSSELNADRLLPQRYGWSIPLSVQLRSSTRSPRFDPDRGDIRVEELLAAVGEDETLTEDQRALQQNAIARGAQTADLSRSFTARLQKSGSSTPLLRYTVDALALSYSYSDTEQRSPSQQFNDRWSWNTSASYRLNIRNPATVTLFGFLREVPLLNAFSDLNFRYLPQSINLSGTAARRFSASRERPDINRLFDEDALLNLDFPLRQQQSFTHGRTFDVQYNPFGFLNMSLSTNTEQSLNALAADSLFSVTITDPDRERVERVLEGRSLEQALAQGEITEEDIGVTAFESSRIAPVSSDRVLSRLLAGDSRVHTDRHQQGFTSTFRPRFEAVGFLDWITLQDVVYSADYNWRNASFGSTSGATVSNRVSLRTGVTLRMLDLFRKIPGYEALEAQEQERRRGGSADEDEGGLPLPNPLHLLRRTFLGLTSARDVQVTYSTGRNAQSSNVGRLGDEPGEVETNYSLLDALRGEGPSLGYRFGFQRSIDPRQRLLDPSLQVADNKQDTHQLQARTTLQMSPALRVNLNWRLDWSEQLDRTFALTESGGVRSNATERGNTNVSVWAFGADYLAFFERQLNTFREANAATPPGEPIDAGSGRAVLTNQTTTKDFRDIFTTSFGLLDGRGLLLFPMPGWTVNYAGLSDWPILRSLTQSVTLRHGYSADFGSDFRTNASADDRGSFSLGGREILFDLPEIDIGSMRVNERFQPFIGVDLTWRGNLQTNVSWNRSNSYTLSTGDNAVRENETSEVSASISFQRQGLSIPLLPVRRLNNRITLRLTVTRSVSDQRRHSLLSALQQAARDPDFPIEDAISDDNSTVVSSTERFTLNPQITYQFSNRVTADFFLQYEQFDDFRLAGTTNVNGGFNVRVSLAN
ncbi:MAG: cell surface protein SprA [Bacteroidetes bacterium]|nr:cell surface protein SprA [Bacteroidota bacterium]